MIESVDQLGDRIVLPAPPRRIVSLVPSQTELLFDLGLDREVVGITRYCTQPAEKVSGVTRVGGTKKFLFDRIDTLRPDLVLGNREENYREGVDRLRARYPVWISDIADLDGALAMIREVARLTGRERAGRALAEEIEAGFAALEPAGALRTAYLIWRKPCMVAGGGTFIGHLLRRAGFVNVFGDQPRYPEVSAEQLCAAAPDLVMLSSEPFPFTAQHQAEFQALLPGARVLRVDGTYFSWYGSRLRASSRYLADLLRRL